MSIVMEINPFNFFTDTNGDALDAGYVYIGEVNKDPRQYPVSVYYDFESTIPAMMPLRTSSGYIVRNGSPTFLFVNGNYSVMVLDSRGRQIYYVPDFLLIGNQSAVTPSDLSGPNGAAMIGFIQAGANAIPRTLLQRGRDAVSIADYANANVDAADAITKMASDYGFVRIPFGTFPVSSDVIVSVRIKFDIGAAISASPGVTVTINNSIESPRQWIFQGDGSYVLGHSHVTDTGENARQVHASWFGAFPNPDPGPDQGPFIQKASDAMGNGRESIIDFDIGNYNVDSPITVSRGCWIRGCGQRRTVFKTQTDGFDMFTTDNIACRFSSIQFELHLGVITTRTSAFIRLNHEMCEIYDVAMGSTAEGIVINGLRSRVQGIIAAYGFAQAPGSALIRVLQGDATIQDIFVLTSGTVGPETLVTIGGSGASGISNVLVRNVDTINPAIPVRVDSVDGNVGNVQINEIRHSGFAGTRPLALVHVRSNGARNTEGVVIDGVTGTSFIEYAVLFDQNGTGQLRRNSVDNLFVSGANTAGIGFLRNGTGALTEITVSPTVNVRGALVPFSYSGGPTQIRISAFSLPEANQGVCYDATIADDSVAQFNLNRSVFTGMVMVTAGYQNFGIFAVRAAATPNVSTVQASANMATAIVPLSGTTGVDGRLTLGVTDSILYLENRLGNSQRISLTLLTGVI